MMDKDKSVVNENGTNDAPTGDLSIDIETKGYVYDKEDLYNSGASYSDEDYDY